MRRGEEIYATYVYWKSSKNSRQDSAWLCRSQLYAAHQCLADTRGPLQQRALEEMPEANKGGGDEKGMANLGSSPCRAAQVKNGESSQVRAPSAPWLLPARAPRDVRDVPLCPAPGEPVLQGPRGSPSVLSQTHLTVSRNLRFGGPVNVRLNTQDTFFKITVQQGLQSVDHIRGIFNTFLAVHTYVLHANKHRAVGVWRCPLPTSCNGFEFVSLNVRYFFMSFGQEVLKMH